MFKKAVDIHLDRLTILAFGQPGVGKTKATETLPGKKLVISLEAGGCLSLAGDESIDIYDVNVDSTGRDLPRDMRIQKFNYCLAEILPKHAEYDWIVVDSLTELSQVIVEGLKKKYPDRSNGFALWGEYNDQLIVILKNLRDLGRNLYITCLDSHDKDESGKRYVGIDINGKIANRVPALFDEIFYLKEFEQDGKSVRKFITGNWNGVAAKDRSGKLNLFEDANLGEIINKIKGGNNA